MIKAIQLSASIALTLGLLSPISSAQNFDSYISSVGQTTVEVDAGVLMGGLEDDVYNFRGVPYAQAERFQMPRPVDDWDGVRPAVTYGENCHIPAMSSVAGDELFNPHRYLPMSEDCQFLNIWTPEITNEEERPVMVWLHGGGFTNGSGIEMPSYDGHNLSKKGDVVVVTLNHRLNVLGFLDLSAYGDEYRYSANASMADIVAALEWIQENIEEFGGDPDNVTIFGQSGGGSKVRTLMGMPVADGLFHKAIVQSGAGSSPTRGDKESGQRVAELTLEYLGLTGEQVGQLAEVPYADLLAAGNRALQQAVAEGLTDRGGWGPAVDGDYIPRDPVANGTGWVDQARDIPLLIGTVLNEFETIIRHSPASLLADNKNNWSDRYAMEKLEERFGDNAEAVAEAFLEAYPDKMLADAYFVDVGSRLGTVGNTMQKAEQSAEGGAPVYSYMFTRESPVMDGIGMAWHCAEIPYVFNNALLVPGSTGGGPAAAALGDRMSQAWINFARNGDPNHDSLPEWPAYTVDGGATMIFDDVSEVRYHHDRELLNIVAGN